MATALVALLLALAADCAAVSTTLDCPFETDFCLWKQDQAADKFDWNLMPWTDQAGTGPSGDHTTGKGHYIHAGSSGGAKGDNAQLISPLLTIPSGQSKCLLFYYTMYGEHVNNLNVYGKTHTTRNRIWSRHGNQGTDWIEARISLPEGTDFQVVIEAVRGDGEKGDIFIDDIKLIDGSCSQQVIPTNGKTPAATTATTKPTSSSPRTSTTYVSPSSKPVTCNFDNDMCSWIQMKNDDFDWTRHQGTTSSYGTGPHGDHTTGKGYYLYTEVSGQTANKTARIQSKTITPRLGTQCLSFWYHMHGDHIGTLNVYLKSTPTIGSPIWTMRGAQGPTWNHAAITVVEGHTPYSIVIEAVMAGAFSGGIAIDDVLLADNACRDAMPPTVHTTVHPGQVVRKCDFETTSICGFTQDKTDNFDWTWTSHTTSSRGTGPSNDHTYGTRSGHYLYTEASARKQGDKARILSPTYHDNQEMCVKFYYYMYGSSMGTLNVYVKDGNNTGRPLFSRSGNQGNRWTVGETTIPAFIATSASGYQMVFEGVRGSGYESDIALDDVSFTVGACSNPGDCTFDSGYCTWSNTGGDEFDWNMGFGMTPSASTGPSHDHTLGTGQGRYLYIETSAPRLPGDKARLVSQTFSPSPSSNSCISFWYSMYGATVGSLNVYIRVPGRTDNMIWHQSGNHSSYWLFGQAPISERFNSYIIIFEGVRGNSYTGDIAIDDITVTTSTCGIIPPNAAAIPQTTAKVTTPSSGTAAFSCNFENDFCGWVQITKMDLSKWKRRQGVTSGTGPSTDHTFGISHGYYILSEPSSVSGKTRDKAQLSSPLAQAGQSCITFWYNMYGSNGSALNVYVQTGIVIPSTPTWKRTGNQGTHWLMGQFSVNVKLPFNVVIEGVSGGNQGVTAIDDVNIANGSCSAAVSTTLDCPFETDFCLWTQDQGSDKFDWNRMPWTDQAGAGPSGDHTNGKGHYIHAGSSGGAKGDNAQLISPLLTIPSGQSKCLLFYYTMYGEHVNNLNVYGKTHTTRNRIWSRHGNQGTDWIEARIPLPGATDFQVVIEAVRGDGEKGDIFIDDIKLIDWPCSQQVIPTKSKTLPATTTTTKPTSTSPRTSTTYVHPWDCTFESGHCTWSNTGGDEFDWITGSGMTSSASTGPSHDHTLGTGQGRYLYIETSAPRLPGDKAWLVSQTFSPSQSGSCISFWYSMYGATVGSLNVYIRVPGRTDNMIWHQSGNHSNYWLFGQVPISERSNSYIIVFEGVRGNSYTGDIAIDDITVTSSTCGIIPPNAAAIPQTTAKVTTPSPGTAAFSCNFENDFCGWVQITKMDLSNWKRRQGVTSGTGPSTDHTFGISHGYYILSETSSVSGKTRDKAQLSSPLVQAGQSCITFWYNMYGSNGSALNVYVQTGIVIPSTPTWKRTGNLGTHWLMGQFSVNVKLPFNVVIEGVSGGSQGVTAIDDVNIASGSCSAGTTLDQSSKPSDDKCTFEDSIICGFSQDLSDDFDWTGNAGSTSSSGTGPSSDHTYDTRLGHYMYIETSEPRRPGDVARLNSFILIGPTSATCLTFWYHMYGISIGTLNVYVLRNGARSSIWQLSGNQGNSWKVAEVALNTGSSNTPYQIVFEGTVGAGYEGDIAIDDFSVTTGVCSSGGTTLGHSSKPTDNKCTFEDSIICGFSQDLSDDFDWTRHEGLTPSYGTGPASDHTYGTRSGHYMYIETSEPRRTGDVARLNSFRFPGSTSPTCLTFWYHMYGISIGTLNVYVLRNGARSSIWQLSGNQGNSWKVAEVSLNTVSSNTPYQIVFEGTVGAGYVGDIAIDDLSVTTGACSSGVIPNVARSTVTRKPTTTIIPQSTMSTKPTSKTTGTTLGQSSKPSDDKCTFENSIICGFSQDHSDDFDWTRNQGSTSSSGTGPSSDHTYDTRLGHYMYIETSAPRRPGDVARLNSFTLTGPTSLTCLTFWYHMYGISIGTLNVYVLRNGVLSSPIWHLSGNQGDSWKVAEVSLSTGSSNTPYQIVFEGTVGAGYEGDIAIDDFSVTTGACSSGVIPNVARSTVTQKPTTTTIPQSTTSTKPTSKTTEPRPTSGLVCSDQQTMCGPLKQCQPKTWQCDGVQDCPDGSDEPASCPTISHSISLIPNVARSTVTQKPTTTIIPQSTTSTKPTSKTTGKTLDQSSKPSDDKCTFENSIICGFSQDHSDDFDWTGNQGSTSSSGTGPSSDHTYDTRLGHYMYIETSVPRRPGDVARLTSFTLTGPTSPTCLTFWYHMYGSSIGTLNVYVLRNGVMDSPIWHLSGNQGDSWKVAEIALSTVSSNTPYQIVLEGTVGAGYEGDIAIDDFSVTTGACSSGVIPNVARPTVTQKAAPATSQQSTTFAIPNHKPEDS
ncbi:MAM and LDL-receptor class A domain-containing protein 1-like isoform X2 [Haliotis asinina]|uniref:MAM and LDL-receptor class A domain-containing protein 1-like isoform X2 n=1 Tax=Haliotis asinina TaxID=109174 RepID=UPI0035325504